MDRRTFLRNSGIAASGLAAVSAFGGVSVRRAEVASAIDLVNTKVNRWETIKDFRILDHDLSVESDELTPSMKVKRKVAEAKHRELIDSMYA